MTRPFRVTDLLDVLIRLEERGHAFYADLAARTKSDRARALFAQLGDEELQHEALYRDLRKTLEDAPEQCNSDPYGQGWLVRVKLEGKPEGLMDAAAYEAYCATA